MRRASLQGHLSEKELMDQEVVLIVLSTGPGCYMFRPCGHTHLLVKTRVAPRTSQHDQQVEVAQGLS